MLEHYRRLLFEPVSVPVSDEDSQRVMDSYDESYSSIYGRGVNPASQLTPQECMSHCKKVCYYQSHYTLINLLCCRLYIQIL